MKRFPDLILSLVFLLSLVACTPAARLVLQGGVETERSLVRTHRQGPYVLIFALDGVGYDQMMMALKSGATPWLSALLGVNQGNGVFAHAYSVPDAVSVLPSTTIPGWTSIFTGKAPAYTGIPGNEWFVREEMRFLAPVPVSLDDTDDTRRAIGDDLVGKALKGQTLFDRINGPVFISLNYMHHGADLFTTNDTSKTAALAMTFEAGKLVDSIPLLQKSYEDIDRNSVPKVTEMIRKRGVPTLQVVYFPGIDLFTHIAKHPLDDQVGYLKTITFPLVEAVLGEYRHQSALEDTYVLFLSDHGFTPVLMDSQHALAAEPEVKAIGLLLQSLGFRERPVRLEESTEQSDYQSVLAYQDGMAYVYLADRSTCRNPGQKCNWLQPPRFNEDVMPAVRAFYQINQGDEKIPQLKGSLDLVLARKPVPIAQDAQEYEVYDGHQLVPISRYLAQHPRPDLIQFDRRIRWLSAGPYGHRAGDVLLLAKSGLGRPIQDRYYFSLPYFSQHGSASAEDSHILFIVARQNFSGEALRKMVDRIISDRPSQLDVAPLVRALLGNSITR